MHKVLPTQPTGIAASAWAATWSGLKFSAADTETKDSVLANVARELEFSVHSLCRTTAGYGERATGQIRAVKMLARQDAWTGTGTAAASDEDLEDARDVVDVIRQTCERVRKGKGRPT